MQLVRCNVPTGLFSYAGEEAAMPQDSRRWAARLSFLWVHRAGLRPGYALNPRGRWARRKDDRLALHSRSDTGCSASPVLADVSWCRVLTHCAAQLGLDLD